MLIERLREETTAEVRKRVAADVTWENCNAPARTFFIETTEPFAPDLHADPNAFLVALSPLAQWLGEDRIRVEGSICSRLRDGVGTAAQLFSGFHNRCGPLRIEATKGFEPTFPRSNPRAASFFSGGIDALALLRSNRLEYSIDHPGYIRDCILIFGFNTYDLDGDLPQPERLEVFERHVDRMRQFVEHVGASLIPLYTNIRSFYPDWNSWHDVGLTAGMASVALSLSGRIDRIEIGSGGVGTRVPPQGPHPWLDHYYSTEAVVVRHAQTSVSRMEKARIVAAWPDALSVIRSCHYRSIPPRGQVNCGECDKCIRTMLVLVALGKLAETPTFPLDDVTPSMLESFRIEDQNDVVYFTQCIDPLIEAGRSDLAMLIREKMAEYQTQLRRRNAVKALKRLTGLDRSRRNPFAESLEKGEL